MSKRLSTGNGFVLDSLTYAIGPLRLSDFIKFCEKTRDTAFYLISNFSQFSRDLIKFFLKVKIRFT